MLERFKGKIEGNYITRRKGALFKQVLPRLYAQVISIHKFDEDCLWGVKVTIKVFLLE